MEIFRKDITSKIWILILVFTSIPLFAQADTENETDQNTTTEIYEQEDYRNWNKKKIKNITLTNNSNCLVKEMKEYPYYQYGPYKKLTETRTSEKISVNKYFSMPHFDISKNIIQLAVVLAVIFFIIFLIVNGHWRLGDKKKNKNVQTENGGENIYNRKFQSELQKLLKDGNYKDAIKVVYLETLYNLNEKRLIKWELAKTPAEYYYEIKNKNIKSDFLNMTTIFLSVRYGNKEADEDMFEKVKDQRNRILKINSQITVSH